MARDDVAIGHGENFNGWDRLVSPTEHQDRLLAVDGGDINGRPARRLQLLALFLLHGSQRAVVHPHGHVVLYHGVR